MLVDQGLSLGAISIDAVVLTGKAMADPTDVDVRSCNCDALKRKGVEFHTWTFAIAANQSDSLILSKEIMEA